MVVDSVSGPVRATVTLFIALLMISLGGCSRSVPQQAELQQLNGESYSWQSLRGQWVVINFWAEWCKPCIEEIPHLNELAVTYSQQLTVLGVNYDAIDPELMRKQRQKMQIDFPLLISDPSVPLGLPRPVVLPTTYIFSPDGQLHKTLVGPQTATGLAAAMSLSILTDNSKEKTFSQ